jgi:hypothetical protein
MDEMFQNISILSYEQTTKFLYNNGNLGISDFAILLGAKVADTESYCNRGPVFTKSNYFNGTVFIHHDDGNTTSLPPTDKNVSIKPVFNLSKRTKSIVIKDHILDNYENAVYLKSSDRVDFTFGEYPQQVESIEIEKQLDELYGQKKYTTTGKTYETVRGPFIIGMMPYVEQHEEIEINGEKYIRFRPDNRVNPKTFLSNETEAYRYSRGYVQARWIKVMPIQWSYHMNENVIVSQRALLSGLGINFTNPKYAGDFDKTDFKTLLRRDLFS